MRFEGRNERAERWLREQSSRLITEIIEDQREGVREVLRDGMEKGRNPRATALEIVGRVNRATKRREGGLIGLTSQQMRYVMSLREELSDPEKMAQAFDRKLRDRRFDSLIKRAIRDKKPLSETDIARIAGRYSDRLLAFRGEVVARTETIGAFHAAQWEGLSQMVERGEVREDAIKLEWRAALDRDTRDSHVALHGKTVRRGEPFVSPFTGARMLHPHDRSLGAPAAEVINCRCHARVAIDSVTGLRDRLSPDELAEARALMGAG